jgi:hypothetical protein
MGVIGILANFLRGVLGVVIKSRGMKCKVKNKTDSNKKILLTIIIFCA